MLSLAQCVTHNVCVSVSGGSECFGGLGCWPDSLRVSPTTLWLCAVIEVGCVDVMSSSEVVLGGCVGEGSPLQLTHW